MDEVNLLSKVIKVVTYLYRGDVMAPNVLISELPNKKVYLSINRYLDRKDKTNKTILFKATKNNVNEALVAAAKWLVLQKKESKNPIEELKEIVEVPSQSTVKSKTRSSLKQDQLLTDLDYWS